MQPRVAAGHPATVEREVGPARLLRSLKSHETLRGQAAARKRQVTRNLKNAPLLRSEARPPPPSSSAFQVDKGSSQGTKVCDLDERILRVAHTDLHIVCSAYTLLNGWPSFEVVKRLAVNDTYVCSGVAHRSHFVFCWMNKCYCIFI